MSENCKAFLPPVPYSPTSLEKIKSFNNLPASQKIGSYWDNLDDTLLSDLKKEIKQHYLAAQDFRCAYCKQRLEVKHGGTWDTDHIIPKDSHPQFMFEPENLCVSCKDCNSIKSNKAVLKRQNRKRFTRTGNDYLICHPHFHNYEAHIRVIREASLYLPKTPEGIKLIEICGLLRFILKFANHDYNDENIGAQVLEISTELAACRDPSEKLVLMNIIRTLVDEGLRKAALAAIKSRTAK